MKTRSLPLLFLILLLTGIQAAAQSQPVKVSADSTMLSKNDEMQAWAYKIKLQNTSKELVNLEVKHRIYLHHESGPRGAESPVSFIEDKQTVAVLKGGETITLTTKGMDFSMESSSKIKADKDILKGIWVRVFTPDGKEVGTFVKPASIAKKMPWQ
jgi:hypothetical protein